MPIVVDCVEEEGVLDDSYQSGIVDASLDSGDFGEAHEHVIEANTVETGVLDDEVVEFASVEITESAVLDDTYSIGGTFTDNAVEHARIRDHAATILEQLVEEEGVLDDASAEGFVASNTVEAGALDDAVETSGTFSDNAVETGVLGDAVRDGVPAMVADTGVLDDEAGGAQVLSTIVAEAGVLNDAVSVGATVSSNALEEAALSDDYQDHVIASGNAEEVGYLDDAAVGGGNAAWRSHVEPWALSRYSNMPWNSMATIGGALFAAGPEGIYQLEGADDAGADIDAELVHDWLNWSPGRNGEPVADHHLKRPRYLYLEKVRVDGELALALGYVTIEGANSESEYPLPDTTATGFVNIRVPLGRGIRSQHFRPTIRNVGGSDFEFGGGRLVVDSLARNL